MPDRLLSGVGDGTYDPYLEGPPCGLDTPERAALRDTMHPSRGRSRNALAGGSASNRPASASHRVGAASIFRPGSASGGGGAAGPASASSRGGATSVFRAGSASGSGAGAVSGGAGAAAHCNRRRVGFGSLQTSRRTPGAPVHEQRLLTAGHCEEVVISQVMNSEEIFRSISQVASEEVMRGLAGHVLPLVAPALMSISAMVSVSTFREVSCFFVR